MPVSSLTFLMVAAFMLLLSPVWVMAKGRVIIKHAYQLERAPAVTSLGRKYKALAGAYVLYDQCEKDLAIAADEKAFLTDTFTNVARAYQIAYQDAYVEYVGAMPSQALVDDIAKTIKAQQQNSVNGMALSLRKWGCRDSRFHKIRDYVKELRTADTAPPEDPALREPKPSFIKKR